jgi:hypothetical protein
MLYVYIFNIIQARITLMIVGSCQLGSQPYSIVLGSKATTDDYARFPLISIRSLVMLEVRAGIGLCNTWSLI